MRKGLLVLISIFIFGVLAACSNTDYAGESGTAGAEEETTEQATVKEMEEEAAAEEPEAEQSEPSLEIIQTAGGSWKDAIDTVWVHSAAVFENTGDVPVEIGETQMNFKATDDSILGTAPMIYAVPSIVAPGETAFISESTILDGLESPEVYKETTYNFGFDATAEDPNQLEVSGVKGTAGDEYTPYTVTGVIKNTTGEMQDDIQIAAALYAEDGTLLGILNGNVSVGVNPDGEAGFELNYPEIPAEAAGQVAEVEVKAYGWTF